MKSKLTLHDSDVLELFDFQAKLTGEKVVLDIGSVKLVKLSKARNGSSDTFYSVRLQIWHEGAERRGGTLSGGQSDVASFVTAGTALSGPMRDRMVASSSRLMVYLGRLGEYVQVISEFPHFRHTACDENMVNQVGSKLGVGSLQSSGANR